MGRPSKQRELSLWMNGLRVGSWRIPARGPMELHYDAVWEQSDEGRPLSLSLPFLSGQTHRGPAVAAYFDNLLPDTAEMRKRLRRRFGVDSIEAFDLLGAIGRDCVGAIQLLGPDEVPGDIKRVRAEALSNREVENLLLRTTGTEPGWDGEQEELRISIAGAQEKTALLWHQGKWHLPLGATPTTHLLKLPLGVVGGSRQIDMRTSVENEWLCAQILAAYGLPVARCAIRTFGEQKVLAVERFDRVLHSSKRYWLRHPQEDFCQATATPVERKYESDGGPGILAIARILQQAEAPQTDLATFLQAQLLFWMLAAPDGHGKNFSLHLLPGGRYRLTPLYDVISVWPAVGPKQYNEHKLKLAMGLSGRKSKHYAMKTIQRRHFNETARKAGYGAHMETIIQSTIERTSQVVERVGAKLPKGFPLQVADTIFAGLRKRAAALEAQAPE